MLKCTAFLVKLVHSAATKDLWSKKTTRYFLKRCHNFFSKTLLYYSINKEKWIQRTYCQLVFWHILNIFMILNMIFYFHISCTFKTSKNLYRCFCFFKVKFLKKKKSRKMLFARCTNYLNKGNNDTVKVFSGLVITCTK